jgi:hypothetical protein
MKPRDVKRSVRAQHFERSAGDAPSIGRVGRVPGTGLSKGVRRRRKRSERGERGGNRARNNRKKVMMVWSSVFMVVALGVMLVAVWLWIRPNLNRSAVEAPTVLERVVSEFDSPSEEDALALVRQALRSRQASMIKDLFHTGSVGEKGVLKFLEAMEAEDGPVTDVEWLSSIDANGMLMDGVIVKFEKDRVSKNRLALLTPDEEGKWKIDFDAFARTTKPSWSQLLEGDAKQGLVRVIVAKDSYFNGPFRDEDDWECYGMATPDREEVLLGYCRKSSPQARAMARIVESESTENLAPTLNRATVEIVKVAGASSRQFEISRVLAEDWVVGPVAFDEGFK